MKELQPDSNNNHTVVMILEVVSNSGKTNKQTNYGIDADKDSNEVTQSAHITA
jgi:hypothetical protein